MDPAYCKYAFFYCVGRSITPQEPATDAEMLRSTRQTPKSAAKCQVVYKPGANFVDAGLHVVVEQSIGTVVSFQPAHLHGTSIGYGASNAIISINFSQRIKDAWDEAQANGHSVSIISGHGKQNSVGLEGDID